MSTASQPRRSARLIAVAFTCSTLLSQQALALTSLSDLPLYALQGVPPNIALTIDDSGSMAWGAVPDDKVTTGDTGLRWRSNAYNAMYYNPATLYVAPPDENGTPRTTSFTNALINGFDKDKGSVNLSSAYRATNAYNPNNTSQTFQNMPTGWDYKADYGVLDLTSTNPNLGQCNQTAKDSFGAYTDNDCYVRVIVSATSGKGLVDLNGDGSVNASDVDERQNFANWYSFYRTRNLATVSAASLAFTKLDNTFRVGFQNLHTCDGFDTSCKDRIGDTSYDSRLSVFSGGNRTNFFKWLQRSPANQGTPLLPALQRTGEMFKTDRAWENTIGSSTSGKYVCRGNYAIMMTDGLWNTNWSTINTDADNVSKTLPDGVAYTPAAPYKKADSAANASLADVAFHYWSQDLRPDLASSDALTYKPVKKDEKPGSTTTLTPYWNPKNDPATWQHMVTYTVGLGLSGSLGADWDKTVGMYGGAYPSYVDGTKPWPATSFDADGNVNDLWHAAINGRGRFYSAESPNDVVKAFEDIVKAIQERQGSAIAASLSSSVLTTETYVFSVKFNSSDWSGKLFAYPVADGNGNGCSGAAGTICTTPKWEASAQLDKQNWRDRVIITNNAGGTPFRWDKLSAAQKSALTLSDTDTIGEQRFNFLRGDRSLEDTVYRERSTVLGDIINSSPAPLYVGGPNFYYPTDADYKAFKEKYADRKRMVYVGANDGMLHGFDAATGNEQIAFVPNAVFSNLNKLTKTGYQHQAFVDGGMIAYDVKIDGAWRTYLFGGLGLGGKAVYALDITDPSTFTETNAPNILKWEFTDAGLGYSNMKPKVARLNNGKTGVVFGAGYMDGTNAPALYVVDAKDGTLLKRIALPTTDGGSTTFNDNGMTGVTLVDNDANGTTDAVYAGDLYGNVWKFDLSGTTTSAWDIAYTGGSGKLPMYVAKASDSTRQPITTEIAVTSHPSGNGVIAYFGTGKYLGVSDISNTQVQSMYAVWNRRTAHTTSLTRSHLLQQKILGDDTTSFSARDARVTSDYDIKWYQGTGLPTTGNHMGWYLDFSTEAGERVHQSPFVRGDRIIFATVTPKDDPCSAGGSSWIYELDANSGSRLDTSPWDYNQDRSVTSAGDTAKLAGKDVPGSAIRNPAGGVVYIDKESVLRRPNEGKEGKVVSSSTGSLSMEDELPPWGNRRSWRELPRR